MVNGFDPMEQFVRPLVEKELRYRFDSAYNNALDYMAGKSARVKVGRKLSNPTSNSKTKTQRTSAPSTKASGASFSNSSGKFKTSKKSLKKYKKINKLDKRGVTYRLEVGNSFAPKRCGWVGHSTMPFDVVNKQLWRGLLKEIVWKCGVLIQNFSDRVDVDFPVGGNFQFTHRFNYDANPTSIDTYTPAAGETYDNVAEHFHIYTKDQGKEFQFINLAYGDSTRSVDIDLVQATVSYQVKSSLKIQNRSKNSTETDDQADDVDNVPVYGKSYESKSNGMRYFYEPTGLYERLVGNKRTGVIQIGVDSNTGTMGFLAEPPQPKLFVGVKKSGKVHLDPGVIKTSVLSEKKTIKLDTLISKLYGIGGGISKIRGEVGTCRVFALEKMLEVNTGPLQTILAMNLAYEHDYKITLAVKSKKRVQTTMVIEDLIGPNGV